MIFQFRIISDENKEFARELLIDSSQTFLDFHHVLQENLGYDPSQLSSFFITNERWEKSTQITLIDMMDEESDNMLIMEGTVLGDHIEELGQRLLYVFDFFSERSFFIELTEVIEKLESKALPKITFEHGDPPPQIDLGIGDLEIPADDFSADTDYGLGDDELSEGFEFRDGDDFPAE